MFFTPGNHDLWVRSRGGEAQCADSMEKLEQVLQLCDECGVHTKPKLLGGGGTEGRGGGGGEERDIGWRGEGGVGDGVILNDNTPTARGSGSGAVWVVPILVGEEREKSHIANCCCSPCLESDIAPCSPRPLNTCPSLTWDTATGVGIELVSTCTPPPQALQSPSLLLQANTTSGRGTTCRSTLSPILSIPRCTLPTW